ncbi:MFS transporter [Peribacillus butanolivorans]|uniref:MFS transporter n=1 Tax=Peribacillus butanolivorans TaxID=421767 RepID=A0AAX0S319_9BACI|nr:MFS transporter [Peribacillus butanolivorans]AXN39880.1 MFS transporter [Peribacillus butanolivorans]PEJ31691.1 MFS transporter [Peribacillus butanolivorans]
MGIHQAANQLEQTKIDLKPRIGLLIIGIIMIGANLRAPLTSVGPLVTSIRDNLGISNTLSGSLTTLPLLAFALLSPFAPKLARRFGMELTLFISLILLTVGIGIRSIGGVTTLFLGTILIGLAIAIGNVLLPSLIKHNFARNIGLMTGFYAVSMNLCGAIGSGISIPISSLSGLGWAGALGCWGILSLITVFFWMPQLKKPFKSDKNEQTVQKVKNINLWRSGLAWQITLFMGLQSFIFYTVITWMPEILEQKGLNADEAGWMLSIMQLAVIPITFIVPILAGRLQSQRLLIVPPVIFLFVGIFGILYGRTLLIPVCMILIGVGVGTIFSLSMMFFSLRTQSTHEATELSGMAQSFGYLLAAVGPVLFGGLHDITHSWTIPLLMLIVVSALIFIVGMRAGKNEYVTTH